MKSLRVLLFFTLLLSVLGVGIYGCKRVNPPSQSVETPLTSSQPVVPTTIPAQPETTPASMPSSQPASMPATQPAAESAPGTW